MRLEVLTAGVVVLFAMAAVPTTLADEHEEGVVLGPFAFEAASDDCTFRLAGTVPGVDLEGTLGDDCATTSSGAWSARCVPYHCALYPEGVAEATREPGLWTDSIEVLGMVAMSDDLGEGKRAPYFDDACSARTFGSAVSCTMDVPVGPNAYYLVSVAPGTCGEAGFGSVARAQRGGDVRTQFAASAFDLFELCFGEDGTWTVNDL